MARGGKKPAEIIEVPVVKSGGVSTFFVLFLFALVAVGCGVGFQFLVEQLEANNASLLASVAALKEELASVKESYASINFENEIAAIGQMKEDLQQTRLQQESITSQISGLKTLPNLLQRVEESVTANTANLEKLSENMNTEADKIGQVKAGLTVVKTNLEGLSKDVHEARESSKTAESKSSGVASDIEALKSSVAKLATEATEAKGAADDKLTQAQAALETQVATASERISAAETALASQIQGATQQAVEAKQLAEDSKKAAAASQEATEAKLADGLELVKQNLAELLDARKGDVAKQAELAAAVAASAESAVGKSDLEAISGQIAELDAGLAAVKKETADQGKSLADSVKSFEAKANRLNANIKMTSNEVSGIREMVTNMVAENEEATEAPPTEE